jgi:outer membrane murein-binding lipoprotein Lpp
MIGTAPARFSVLFPLVYNQLDEWIVEAGAEIPAAPMARSPTTGGRGQMSTAGKVLVVFVMLFALVWMLLAGGVAQLNRNGNQALQKLSDDLEKVEANLETAKHDILDVQTQTTLIQETVDRDLTVLRSRQTDLEDARSQIVENLSRLQYELATIEDTIKNGQATLTSRIAEHQEEEKAMDNLRTEVRDLIADNSQLMGRLKSLRDQFQATHHNNVEMLGKSSH